MLLLRLLRSPGKIEAFPAKMRPEALFGAESCSDASLKAVFVHNFNAFY
jgi:hypothetical protein